MSVKEILGYICLAVAVISFVTMYLVPKIQRKREASRSLSGSFRKGGS